MMFSRTDRIAQILLGYSFGWRAAIGAAAFVVLTLLALAAGLTDLVVSVVIVLVSLAAALLTLWWRATRPLGIGFFAMLLVSTAFEWDFSKIWWITVRSLVVAVTGPYLKSAEDRTRDRARLSEWLAVRKGRPLALAPARDLVNRMNSCVVRIFPDDVPPTQAELLAEPGCSSHRYWALGERDERSVLHGPDDHGWRWTYERLPGQTRLGGSNYRIVARPDPLLEVPGPIVERDGDGRILIRETEMAPRQTFYTPIPMMKRFRECVIAASRSRPANTKRWPYLPESSEMQEACKEWRLVASTAITISGDRSYAVNLYPPSDSPRTSGHGILYRVLSPGRFELRSSSGLRRFLLDSDGNLHLTTENRDAEVSDGPPEPCELDITIACDVG